MFGGFLYSSPPYQKEKVQAPLDKGVWGDLKHASSIVQVSMFEQGLKPP